MRQVWCTAVHSALLGAGLISTLLARTAYACAVCGGAEDNGYFWGVLFLMSMPFAIGSFVGGWLLYSYRRAPSDPAPQRRPPQPKDARAASASSTSAGHEARP
jgi:hypothetical protein